MMVSITQLSTAQSRIDIREYWSTRVSKLCRYFQ